MVGSYSSDELKTLVRILNEILARARTSRPDLSTDDVVERVFTLADGGERDADNLHNAVFGPTQARQAADFQAADLTPCDRKLSIAGMQSAMCKYTGVRRHTLA